MNNTREKASFGFLMLLLLVLMFMVVAPFMNPLAWSVLFCVLARPMYVKLLAKFNGRHENALSIVMTVVILVFMMIPIAWIFIFVLSEIVAIGSSFIQNGGLPGFVDNAVPYLQKLPFIGSYFDNAADLVKMPMFEKLASYLFEWFTTTGKAVSGKLMTGTVRLVMLFAVVGFSAFYFLRDGDKMIDFVKDLLPVEEERKAELFEGISNTLRAIVYGLLLTAAVQGVVGAVGWYFAGLPTPVFFGFMMFVFGMIPMVGTPVVWGSGVLYLLACGDFTHALFLFVWGAGFVCTIDNIVRPIFISSGGELNMLLVFLGLLGGLYMWGFIGLFYGPLVLSVGLYLLETYRHDVVDGKQKKTKLRIFSLNK